MESMVTYKLQTPPTDTISSLSWSENSNFLCATSWDCEAKVYNTAKLSYTTPMLAIKHEKPLLASTFIQNDHLITSGGDALIKITNLQTKQSTILGKVCVSPFSNSRYYHSMIVTLKHDAPVSSLLTPNVPLAVLSGSWDRTIRAWDPRMQKDEVFSIPDVGKVYAMDTTNTLVAAGVSDEAILVWDIRKLPETLYKIPLYDGTITSVALNAKGTGLYAGTNWGSVIMCDFGPTPRALRNPPRSTQSNPGLAIGYSINAITISSTGEVLTGGSDGIITHWNNIITKRNRETRRPLPVTALAVSPNGKAFANAIGYNWDRGPFEHDPKMLPEIQLVQSI